MTERVMTECPEHGGNFDCTPFCPVCAGEQEVALPLPAHRFIGTADPYVSECLTCGGIWQRNGSELGSVRGDTPSDCRPAAHHHYPGECFTPSEACARDAACNCLACDS